jgi:hypothetical protein
MIRKFELYDSNNDYYYEKIKEDGKIELYDKNKKGIKNKGDVGAKRNNA